MAAVSHPNADHQTPALRASALGLGLRRAGPGFQDPLAGGEQVPEMERLLGKHWGAAFKPMTPFMKERGGRLGINRMKVPTGRSVIAAISFTG